MATFAESVQSYINSSVALINTSIPAKVIKYDANTQKCIVQPLLRVLLKDERVFLFPEIDDVPVVFPSTDSSMLTFPIKQNDTVLLVFSQRSLDKWLSSRNVNPVNPEDFRKHDYSDAIAIPGLFSFPRAINEPSKHTTISHNTNDTVLKHNIGTSSENEVRLKENGSIVINAGESTKVTLNPDGTLVIDAPTGMTVNSPTTTWVGDINQQGTFTSDTDVIASGVSLTTHTHGGVQTGGGNTGVPN